MNLRCLGVNKTAQTNGEVCRVCTSTPYNETERKTMDLKGVNREKVLSRSQSDTNMFDESINTEISLFKSFEALMESPRFSHFSFRGF